MVSIEFARRTYRKVNYGVEDRLNCVEALLRLVGVVEGRSEN